MNVTWIKGEPRRQWPSRPCARCGLPPRHAARTCGVMTWELSGKFGVQVGEICGGPFKQVSEGQPGNGTTVIGSC